MILFSVAAPVAPLPFVTWVVVDSDDKRCCDDGDGKWNAFANKDDDNKLRRIGWRWFVTIVLENIILMIKQ